MKHAIPLSAVLALVWLVWSGHTEPLILGLGALSVLVIVALSVRLAIVDDEGAPPSMNYARLLGYLPWLALEIVKANLDVARRIVAPGPPRIAPQLLRVPAEQRTPLTQVIYANSITLTPGTVSVDLREGEILVHALHAGAAAGVREGSMAAKCAALNRRTP